MLKIILRTQLFLVWSRYLSALLPRMAFAKSSSKYDQKTVFYSYKHNKEIPTAFDKFQLFFDWKQLAANCSSKIIVYLPE